MTFVDSAEIRMPLIARVHRVRAHQRGLDALRHLSYQLVGQGLEKAHSCKLAGAVTLSQKTQTSAPIRAPLQHRPSKNSIY